MSEIHATRVPDGVEKKTVSLYLSQLVRMTRKFSSIIVIIPCR